MQIFIFYQKNSVVAQNPSPMPPPMGMPKPSLARLHGAIIRNNIMNLGRALDNKPHNKPMTQGLAFPNVTKEQIEKKMKKN